MPSSSSILDFIKIAWENHFLNYFRKQNKNKNLPPEKKTKYKAELSMPQHLTSGSMQNDLSTETKYLKSEKGNISKPTTLDFVSAMFRKTLSEEECKKNMSRTKAEQRCTSRMKRFSCSLLN